MTLPNPRIIDQTDETDLHWHVPVETAVGPSIVKVVVGLILLAVFLWQIAEGVTFLPLIERIFG